MFENKLQNCSHNQFEYSGTSEIKVNSNNSREKFYKTTVTIGELITAECASVVFVFLYGRLEYNSPFVGHVVGVGGAVSKTFGLDSWMITGLCSVFRAVIPNRGSAVP